MGTELAKLDSIPLPDLQRLERPLSLPAWVREPLDVLKLAEQPDETGKYRTVPTLPEALMLNSAQATAVSKYVDTLEVFLAMTPENDLAYGQATLSAVGKMFMTLAGREGGEMAGEARGDAYMAALEDIPSWAVEAAVRRWYRGECGPKHDYRWAPAPAVLRDISRIEQYRCERLRRQMQDLLIAEPNREFGEQHCSEMRQKIRAISPVMAG